MYEWIAKIRADYKYHRARGHFAKFTLVLILLFIGLVDITVAPYLYKQAEYLLNGREETASEPDAVSTSDWLSIPTLGIEAPIVYVTEKSEEAYQAGLHNGVVHYPGTALPGEFGNVYIFGHSSDLVWVQGNYKTVFALLPKIQLGDEIRVSNDQGEVFTYIVTDTMIVNPSDTSVLDQFEYTQQLLTVQTSYPIGTALKRFIVRAELLDENQDSSETDND